MKKLFKNIIILVTPFLIFSLFFFSLKINFHDWKHGHSSFNMTPRSINWFLYDIEVGIKKLQNSYFSKKRKGLDTVNLIVSEKSSKNLLSEIPKSTKKWNPAYLINGDKLQEVEIRYFGDNPYNFMFEQKNIRLKTRKSEMFGKKRYFEYQTSQIHILDEYLPKKIAKKLGILAPEVRLVELFINNQSHGIHIERERLNESFLRRNKIMPINLYKGEDYNIEKKLGLDSDLYNNPGLWRKIARFNYMEEDDKRDLAFFLAELKKADNSYKDLNKILSNDNIEIWSKISVFQILNQNHISNHIHNARLLIDPWSGKIYLIPHDLVYITNLEFDEITMDWSNNLLFQIINRNSEFLDQKYNLLYQTLTQKKILSKQANELEKIKDKFLISQKRDIGFLQKKYYSKLKKSESDFRLNNLINDLKKREKTLINILEKKPEASWNLNKNGFSIKVDGLLPISDLRVNFDTDYPKWIALDTNNNSLFDDEDRIFYPDDENNFKLPITFYANRTSVTKQNSKIYRNSKLETSNTYFNFITEKDINPLKIYGSNKFTNKSYILPKKNSAAVSPDIHNKPIFNILSENNVKVFSGDIKIDKDIIIINEAKILPGTSFYLNEGASIVFKNKVSAEGTASEPIVFKKIDKKQKPWGTIAIHGKKSTGSIFKNIIIEGGSGDIIDNIYYISMLSLHDTKQIKLQNLKLRNNDLYDDMLHVVYSDDIKISDLLLESSKHDAIDIDISTNVNISNSKIYNSGNDGIDIMESQLNVYRTLIDNSKDKGISTGESSRLKVYDSTIENNDVGIASKDGSIATIINSKLNFNNFQLSAYKKNWRYGSGGKIFADNLNFLGNQNFISSEDNSEVLIKNSSFKGVLKKTGNVLID